MPNKKNVNNLMSPKIVIILLTVLVLVLSGALVLKVWTTNDQESTLTINQDPNRCVSYTPLNQCVTQQNIDDEVRCRKDYIAAHPGSPESDADECVMAR